jgi:hypothetical protein
MTDEDLDRILSREEEILPSAGFASRVIESVRSEATSLPPIPFPWKRALPGLAAVGLALGSIVVALAETVRRGWATPPTATGTVWLQPFLHSALHGAFGPIALGLIVSLAALRLSMRLTAN